MLTLDTSFRFVLAAGLCLLPLGARADCMTAMDLAAGFMVQNAETGDVSLHLRQGPDLVSEYAFLTNGAVTRIDRLYGLYFSGEFTTEDGSTWVKGYQTTFEDPEAIPLPEPGLDWTAKATSFDGFDETQVIVSYTIGDVTTIAIDGCPYRVALAESTLQGFGDDANPETREITRALYFVDLGTSVTVNSILPGVKEDADSPPPARLYRRP